jgi:hypothetical protein
MTPPAVRPFPSGPEHWSSPTLTDRVAEFRLCRLGDGMALSYFPLGWAHVVERAVAPVGVVPAFYVVEDFAAQLSHTAPGPGRDELSLDGGEK